MLFLIIQLMQSVIIQVNFHLKINQIQINQREKEVFDDKRILNKKTIE